MKKPSPNKRPSHKTTLGYAAVLAVTLVIAIVLGWTSLASQIDDDAYDVMFRLHPPPASPPHCLILAIDDATYGAMGGVRAYRSMLAKALELLAPAQPKVVAIDMVLADQEDAPEDDRLLRAMQSTKDLVLVAHLQNGLWEDPLANFAGAATALGHDRADERSRDGVTRQIPLEERTARERHWALALETFRLARGQRILESPGDLQIGNEVIPAPRTADNNRSLRVLFSRDPIPQISLLDLVNKPELAARFRGQTVFVGVTSIDATYDRVATPYGEGRIPGVDVHAQLFETLERGKFLIGASNLLVLGLLRPGGRSCGLDLCVSIRLARLHRRWSPASGRARRPVLLFPARHRLSLLRAVRLGLAYCHRRRQLPAFRGAARAAPGRNRAPALPAGHPFRHPRNAHAAHRHPGIERIDGPL